MSNKKAKNPKVEKTQEIFENLKTVDPVFRETLKTTEKYAKQLTSLVEAGKIMVESLKKLSQTYQGDIGDGITHLADATNQIETKYDNLQRTMINDLVNPALQTLEKEGTKEVKTMEADFRKGRQKMQEEVRKAEQLSQKAGKKSAESLQLAITNLTDKMKQLEEFHSQQLRSAILLERKKYCAYLLKWTTVVQTQIDMYRSSADMLQHVNDEVINLATQSTTLPNTMEELTRVKEQTYTNIQPDTFSEYFADLDEQPAPASPHYGRQSSFGTPGATPSPPSSITMPPLSHNTTPPNLRTSYHPPAANAFGNPPPNNQGYATPNKPVPLPPGLPPLPPSTPPPPINPKAKALYDYAPQQHDELQFYAGDTITVLREGEDGWWFGELNGVQGVFPGNYVEKM